MARTGYFRISSAVNLRQCWLLHNSCPRGKGEAAAAIWTEGVQHVARQLQRCCKALLGSPCSDLLRSSCPGHVQGASAHTGDGLLNSTPAQATLGHLRSLCWGVCGVSKQGESVREQSQQPWERRTAKELVLCSCLANSSCSTPGCPAGFLIIELKHHPAPVCWWLDWGP